MILADRGMVYKYDNSKNASLAVPGQTLMVKYSVLKPTRLTINNGWYGIETKGVWTSDQIFHISPFL